jgi:hypothetical protein
MTIDNALASLAVKDLKAAAAWYEKLFRRPADSTPMPEVAEWKFDRGGWLQVYQLPERAGSGSCTLAVSLFSHSAVRIPTSAFVRPTREWRASSHPSPVSRTRRRAMRRFESRQQEIQIDGTDTESN